MGSNVTLHAEGTPICSFKSSAEVPIRSLRAHFTPTQSGSGDPSPSNIREINGRNELQVWKTGKNLLNQQLYQYKSTVLSFGGNSAGTTDGTLVLAAGTYTFSTNAPAGTIGIRQHDGAFVKVVGQSTSVTFTIEDGTDIVIMMLSFPTEAEALSYNYQLEVGSVATTYEPYKGQVIPITFPVLGKNKFDKTAVHNGYVKYEDGDIVDVNWYYYSDYIPVYGQTLYLWNTNDSNSILRGTCFYDKNKNFISAVQQNTDDNSPRSISIPSGAVYVRVNIAPSKIDEAMVSIDEEPTTYEAYSSNNTVYGGYIDPIKEKLYVTYRKVEIPVNDIRGGTGGFVDNPSYQGSTFTHRYFIISKSSNPLGLLLGNYMSKGNTGNSAWKLSYDGTGLLHYSVSNDTIGVTSETSAADRDTALAAWLAENNPYIIYALATPIEYSLTLVQLTALRGQNHIWSSVNNKTEVDYDLHETRAIQFAKRRIAANEPHIETKSGPIVTFNTDLKADLKECKVEFKPQQELNGYSNPWPAGGGKNLFNINVQEQNPSDTTSTNTTLRTFTPNTYCVGASWSNWWMPNQVTSYSINNGVISVQNNNVYGIGFPFKLTPETTYTISATTTNGGVNVAYYDNSGTYITTSNANILNQSFTTPVNADITVLVFYSGNTNAAATFSNIQLEKGSSATSYVPYENICPINGWTNINIKRSNKNILDLSDWYFDSDALSGYITISNNIVRIGTMAYLERHNIYQLPPGSNYIFSCDAKTISLTNERAFVSVLGYNDAGTSKGSKQIPLTSSGYEQHVTFSVPADATNIRFANWAWSGVVEISNLQLEINIEETVYESANFTKIPIAFPATKNLFGGTFEHKYIDGDGVITSSSSWNMITLNVTAGEKYTISGTSTNASYPLVLCAYDAEGNKLLRGGTNTTGNVSYTLTVPTNGVILRACAYGNNTVVSNVQVEKNTTATFYEPYGTIYGGYVDYLSGRIVAEWSKEILDGSRTYTVSSDRYMGTNFTDCWTTLPASNYNSNIEDTYSLPELITDNLNIIRGNLGSWMYPDSYPWSATINISSDTQFHIILGNKEIGADSSDTRSQRATKIKTYLGNHPITVVYKLATPITYQLTPTQLKSLLGTNNIWSNANGNTTVSYWTH